MASTPGEVAEPHKEVRFTRSAQGQLFGIAAFTAAGIAVVIALFAFRTDEALLPRWWVGPPIALAVFLARFSHHCLRHAYLLLTPLGVEIFPLWKPQKNLHVVFWSEIAHAEVDPAADLLTLHHDDEKTSGVVVSLKPILKGKHSYLIHAIEGLMAKRAKAPTP
jgi:hypothetical protein